MSLDRNSRARTMFLLLMLLLAGIVLAAAPDPQQRTEAPQDPQRAESDPDATGETKTQEPREIGLVERARRGLAQLDVTVRGPWEAISDLSAADFDLVINGETMQDVIVDRLCRQPSASRKAERKPDEEEPSGEPLSGTAVQRLPAAFLFYFDQHLLTLPGRANALDTARKMIPELVRDGNRAAIVSAGKRLDTFADLTGDVDELLQALDRIEGDREQWLTYAQEEEYRIREVLKLLEVNGILAACGAARRFEREEAWKTEKALRLFSLTLGHLAELDPPKVVFYFADMLRRDAGKHYMTYAGGCGSGAAGVTGGSDAGPLSGFGAVFAIDSVIEQASAHGTRVYTVRPEGLVSPTMTSTRYATYEAAPMTNLQRFAHAGDSLTGLSLETGGQAFISGETPGKILGAVEADLGCIYLLSFDPSGLPEDQPLRVLLRMNRPKVKAQVRGRLILQSESEARTAKLMAAFAAPGSVLTDVPIHGIVVPTGFTNGRYTALVQLRAPGSPLSTAEWDIGASLLSSGEFANDVSGQVKVDRPAVPIVFETEMRFKPGPFELILVAHESVADQLGTARLEGSWPERQDGVAMGPLAVMQPGEAVFVRDGELRRGGALGRHREELLRTDLPTALIGLVCRGPSKKQNLRVERILVGEAKTRFPEMQLELGEERCAQFRDLIPASTMTPGRFVYRVRVSSDGVELASSDRAFAAVDDSSSGGRAPEAAATTR